MTLRDILCCDEGATLKKVLVRAGTRMNIHCASSRGGEGWRHHPSAGEQKGGASKPPSIPLSSLLMPQDSAQAEFAPGSPDPVTAHLVRLMGLRSTPREIQ